MKLLEDEVPLHFESVRLRRSALAVGWPLAIAAGLIGVTLTASAGGAGVELLGVALAALGALLVAALVRCKAIEIAVGRRMVVVTSGPLRRRLPIGLIVGSDTRPAASWRRLYADRELVLTLSTDQPSIITPTADPDALEGALRGVGQWGKAM